MSLVTINTPDKRAGKAAPSHHFMAGRGGFPLVGTHEHIVDQLQKLSDAGLDGIVR